MNNTILIQFTILFVLLFLSAFFSSAETALTTVSRVRIKSLAEEGNKKAITLGKILDNHRKMLSTILIGNNIVNITASSLTTTMTIQIWGNYVVGISTGILTVAILLFGEILPKNRAMLNPEKFALSYAKVILPLITLFSPIIFVVDKLSTGIMRLLRIDVDRKSIMTENELKNYVDASHEDGVIESEERAIIYNVFEFSDTVAKDIMIPRIDMTTVDQDTGYEELLEVFKNSMYTRIPVYHDDKENIVGLVNIKDFILVDDSTQFQLGNILREAYFTYEFKKTADLLLEMREKTNNIAFVLNEYGACVGMITLEDLLEEIVGEIRDEYDADEEELISQIDSRQYLVSGGMKLDDVNDALDTHLNSEEYDSLAGIIIEILDRMPEIGDEVVTDDQIALVVKELNQNRITKVLLTLPDFMAVDFTKNGVPEEDTPDVSDSELPNSKESNS